MFKAGISFVDLEGARKNLNNELDHWDFKKVRSDAEKDWIDRLELIKIKGATAKKKKYSIPPCTMP
jgi:putative alpha-1,2-mannosidase